MTEAEKQVIRQMDAAKRQLERSIKELRSRLDSVERCLEKGLSLNHIGELQNTTSLFESAVGAYERLSQVAALIEG